MVLDISPESMILGTMIPIPKDKKKSLCSSSNYRAIALSSNFSKILDWIILIKEKNSLCTSELQFGFKKGLSTTQCTFCMLEVIDYYNVNKLVYRPGYFTVHPPPPRLQVDQKLRKLLRIRKCDATKNLLGYGGSQRPF